MTQLSLFPDEKVADSSDQVTRRCSVCENEKELSHFHKANHMCKPCSSKYHSTLHKIRRDNSVPEKHACPICQKVEADLRTDTMNPRGTGNIVSKSPWRVDHCHKTNIFRDFLCHKCNLGLGFLEDSPSRLTRALEYLDKHNGYTD